MLLLSISESIRNVFATIFQDNVILATILIAILPIIELRGAIPFAMEKVVWGANALSSWEAFLYAFIGSSLVIPFVALAFIPIMNFLKKTKWFQKIALWIEQKVQKHSHKMMEGKESTTTKKTHWLKMFGIFAFVAVPLPLTGVWTGTAVAVVIGLDFWSSCISALLGNLTAGLLITLLSSIFDNASTIILLAFVAIIALMVLYAVIKMIIHHFKKTPVVLTDTPTTPENVEHKEEE